MDSIDKCLTQFLKDDKLRVVALKGDWGIGKTYFWRNFFKSVKNELNFRAYSYISLFGVQEIGDLRRQVFSNFEMLGKNSLSNQTIEKIKPIKELLKSVDIPYFNSSKPINDLIESKFIENFLICVDDLERKEKTVSGSSVLGFISQLKEEKSCKIILIYNDQELDEETQKQINEYREKVIDLELTYHPTIDENLAIIWAEGYPNCVRDIFHAIELNNIRVMQRVKWSLDYFSQEIRTKYPNLYSSFERKCVILTVVYHAFSKHISVDEALMPSYSTFLPSQGRSNKSHFDILKKLKYLPEEQDQIIFKYLVDGYVDLTLFEDLLHSKNKQYRLNDVNENYREIWQKYDSNFVVSQEEFIRLQSDFLKKHIRDLNVSDVAEAVKFINKLDPSINLEPLLSESIELFITKLNKSDQRNLSTLRMDPEIISRIEEKLAIETQDYSIAELFFKLAGSDSWHRGDIKHLLKYSEEDFLTWITTEQSLNVIDLLIIFFRRFGDQNEDEKIVVSTVRKALDKVKERSPLDKYRVEHLIENNQSDFS